MKRIPIKAAKDVARAYNQDQVILVTWDKAEGLTHVVTYGKTEEDCDQAAQGGNFFKKAMDWPESHCVAEPARVRRLRGEIKQLKTALREIDALAARIGGLEAALEFYAGSDSWSGWLDPRSVGWTVVDTSDVSSANAADGSGVITFGGHRARAALASAKEE